MCNRELLSIVKEVKNKNMSRFGELLGSFEGLICYFAGKLGFDDAAQELTVFLLELVCSMNTDCFLSDESEELNKYISVCIRNRYILISKKLGKSALEENELSENLGFCVDFENSIVLKEGMSRLSVRQREAIILRYIYGFSDSKIAERLGITRQAVNRLERRGLKIMREYLCDYRTV